MRHSVAFLQLFDISTLWGFCLHWESHLLMKILSKVKSSVQSQHVCFNNAYHLLDNSRALGQRQLHVCDPGSCIVPRSEGPALGFMLRCCRVEILSSFWTRCLCFLFILGPTNYNPGSWCLYILSHLKFTTRCEYYYPYCTIKDIEAKGISWRS